MATNGEVQNPPILDDYTNYDNWLKDLDVWKMFTSTPKTKQGPRLYLSLKGKARDRGGKSYLFDFGKRSKFSNRE